MASPIYIVESHRSGRGRTERVTAFLNREPDLEWSSHFLAEAEALGVVEDLRLRRARIVASTPTGATAQDVVNRVNARLSA